MSKKPTALLSCGLLSKEHCSHQRCSRDSSAPGLWIKAKLPTWQSRRCLHGQIGSHNSKDYEEFPWPRPSSSATSPTPYEILRLQKGNPYSKHVFYELVKIYHPDRHTNGNLSSKTRGLSQAIKLERYRLIIAANDILSDPVKRSAYDRYGVGWDGFKESDTLDTESSRNSRWSGFEDNESIFRNATWEDWEKWHQRNNAHRPEPIYLEKRSFFTLIAFITALAAVSQFSKAGQASQTFIEQVGARHDASSKNLHESRFGHHQDFPDRDQRIQKFLHCREQVDPVAASTDEDTTSSLTIRTEKENALVEAAALKHLDNARGA